MSQPAGERPAPESSDSRLSTGTAVPVGAKQAKVNGSVSSPQISRCASIDQCASDSPFDTAPLTVQPVEAQPAEIVIAIFSATSPSYSNPPNIAGRQVRSNSASRIFSTICGNRLRLRSVSSASARISGTIARARAISSSGLGTASRRIAAVLIGGVPPLSSLVKAVGPLLQIDFTPARQAGGNEVAPFLPARLSVSLGPSLRRRGSSWRQSRPGCPETSPRRAPSRAAPRPYRRAARGYCRAPAAPGPSSGASFSAWVISSSAGSSRSSARLAAAR